MVINNEHQQPCWHYPAWNLPNSNRVTALLEPMHHTNNLPSSFNSHAFTANAVSQGISALVPAGLPDLRGVHGVFQRKPTHINCLSPSTNPYMNESRFGPLHVVGREVVPTSARDSSGKDIIIFDQSGDQTRLFFSPSCPPQNELLSRNDNGLHHGKLTALIEHKSPGELIIQEQLDKNCSNSYGSEDTEEINALLYSDDGDDGDVDSEDDDEVTSTGHSPLPVQFGELTEEDIASSDGSSKRQRLHDGGYKKSSLKDTASSGRSYRYNDDDEGDVESSCFKDKNSDLHAREKKVKIREMLRTLEAMIPGLNSKDPLSVIDEAIDYLKCLRVKAKEYGVELLDDSYD